MLHIPRKSIKLRKTKTTMRTYGILFRNSTVEPLVEQILEDPLFEL